MRIERSAERLEVAIEPGEKTRRVRRRDPAPTDSRPEVHRFGHDATLCVGADTKVKPGTRLLDLGDPDVITVGRDAARRQRRWWRRDRDPSPFGVQFRWRVKPTSLLREFAGKLDENSRWVNVSDGGHIENLGVFELLRRRCQFIVVGDAEHDPKHEFGGLTILMRAARLELDTRIVIDLDPLRPDERGHCAQHWAIGRIHYPGKGEPGYLLYLKSSLTGDEDEDIVGYHVKSPTFPHEGTADQFFDEGQFEAYRRLGYHIAKGVLREDETFERYLAEGRDESPQVPFDQVRAWFKSLVPESIESEPVDDAPGEPAT